MSKIAEMVKGVKASVINLGLVIMLGLVPYQKETLPKAAGREDVIVSCGQLLTQEGKNEEVWEHWQICLYILFIPYQQIKKITNFKDLIYGL